MEVKLKVSYAFIDCILELDVIEPKAVYESLILPKGTKFISAEKREDCIEFTLTNKVFDREGILEISYKVDYDTDIVGIDYWRILDD